MNIAQRRFLYNRGNMMTEESQMSGVCPILIRRFQGFFI